MNWMLIVNLKSSNAFEVTGDIFVDFLAIVCIQYLDVPSLLIC